ncbi:MAG: hypothetical protein H0V66_15785 [Bdellovibrionales bacterium]|nr:hypothetical protein [Bdellovibrionales bacterium]
MKQIIVTFILAVFSFSLQAKILELKKNSGTIFIAEKSKWKLGKDLFGMPFIYFSPQQNGQRSNISFTDTGAELELDIKTLATTQEKYQAGRKKWAQTVGADSISYEPYQVKVNKNGHRIHRVGFNYAHEGKEYAEKSYYIECKGKLLFSKTLRLKENAAHENDFADLLSSLDCGGV